MDSAPDPLVHETAGFHVEVGNFERDNAVIAQVDGPVDRGHPAGGDLGVDAVRVDVRRTACSTLRTIPLPRDGESQMQMQSARNGGWRSG